MVRRYDESVEVQTVPEGQGGGAPSAFLWRGRVYAVRAIDAHWQERRAWWRDHGSVSGGSPTRPAGREIWRVRAQAGRTGSPGVFELGTDAPDGAGPWLLLTAHD